MLGEEWQETAIFLKFLAILGFFNALNLFLAMVRKAMGSGKELLNETILERIVRLLLLFVFLEHGLILVIIGQIIGSICGFLFRIYRLRSFLGVCFFKAINPFLSGLLLMTIALTIFWLNLSYFPQYFDLLLSRCLFIFFATMLTLFIIKNFYYSEVKSLAQNIFLKNK